MDVGEAARRLREEARLTQGQVAEAAELDTNTVSAFETGKSNPRRNTIEAIAKALGHTYDSLHAFALSEDRRLNARALSLGGGDGTPGHRQLLEVTRMAEEISDYRASDIPLITEAEASPDGLTWDADNPTLTEAIEWVSRPFDVDDPKAYAVLVRNDSMLPAFRPGLWVIASPRAPVDDGDEVVVQLRTRERMVKIARRIPGGYLLESTNPIYQPRIVTAEEILSMHAIVYSRRKRPGRRVVQNHQNTEGDDKK